MNMNLTRRRFLRTGSMVGFAAVVGRAAAPLAFGQKTQELGSGIGTVVPKQVLADPLYNMTSAMFRDSLNTKFAFSLGGVQLCYMVLIQVNDLNPPNVRTPLTNGRECFSVVFQGPRKLPLRSDMYTIEQGKLGKFQLTIVPGSTSDPSGLHYEAVINRLFP